MAGGLNIGGFRLGKTLFPYVGAALDADVSAFAAESGATDLTGLNDLVRYLKGQSLYGNFVIYPMKSAQNAGSGSTVYSLGGLTTTDLTLVGSPTWESTGIDYNGTTQWATSTITGSKDWTEFSAGVRLRPDAPSSTDPSPPQAFLIQGDNNEVNFCGLSWGTAALSGEILTLNQQQGATTNRKGNTTFTWTADEDFTFSANLKTVTMSANGATIANNLSTGAKTDYTPSQHSGTVDSIYFAAIRQASSAIIPFDGTMVAGWICDAAITDAQRHEIDTLVAAL